MPVGVLVPVLVGVTVSVGVSVLVGVLVGVSLGVPVAVGVGTGVRVMERDRVAVPAAVPDRVLVVLRDCVFVPELVREVACVGVSEPVGALLGESLGDDARERVSVAKAVDDGVGASVLVSDRENDAAADAAMVGEAACVGVSVLVDEVVGKSLGVAADEGVAEPVGASVGQMARMTFPTYSETYTMPRALSTLTATGKLIVAAVPMPSLCTPGPPASVVTTLVATSMTRTRELELSAT